MKYLHLNHAIALAASMALGCGAAALPVGRVASTEAAIRAARETGAANVPRAALHLHYAEQQSADAQTLNRNGDSERAALALRRAEADANLAVAIARQSQAERDAHAAVEAQNSPKLTARR